MVIHVSQKERDWIALALDVLADQFAKLGGQCTTRLADGFSQDSRDIRCLADRVKQTER
jgi:hypothetical protein